MTFTTLSMVFALPHNWSDYNSELMELFIWPQVSEPNVLSSEYCNNSVASNNSRSIFNSGLRIQSLWQPGSWLGPMSSFIFCSLYLHKLAADKIRFSKKFRIIFIKLWFLCKPIRCHLLNWINLNDYESKNRPFCQNIRPWSSLIVVLVHDAWRVLTNGCTFSFTSYTPPPVPN